MALVQQEITLSLTDFLMPPIVHVKQYDTTGRQIVCTILKDSVEYVVSTSLVITVSGERPDGEKYAYTSTLNPEVVAISNGKVVINLQDEMTACHGATAVDITLVDGSNLVGVFPFALRVEKVAVPEAEELAKVLGTSYSTVAEALAALQDAITTAKALSGDSDGSITEALDKVEELTALIESSNIEEILTKLEEALASLENTDVSQLASKIDAVQATVAEVQITADDALDTARTAQETATEALSKAGTGSSATPDYAVNDPTADGYIANRPCYFGEVEEVVLGTVSMQLGDELEWGYEPLQAGDTYRLSFSTGESFEFEAFSESWNGVTAAILGDSFVELFSGTLNPVYGFLFLTVTIQGVIYVTFLPTDDTGEMLANHLGLDVETCGSTTHTITITHMEQEIAKLDKRLLPDDIQASSNVKVLDANNLLTDELDFSNYSEGDIIIVVS